MTTEAAALRAAIANRTHQDFEARCAALADILHIANFGDDHSARAGAIKHLQEVEGVAVITDVAQPPVLATSNGVHIEPRVAYR